MLLPEYPAGELCAQHPEDSNGCTKQSSVHDICRKSFPPGFIFGAATSSYQIEGAINEGGRGVTVWDTESRRTPDFIQAFRQVVWTGYLTMLTATNPRLVEDASNGDVACDSYHLYKEDIKLLANVGFDSYRFSIAWSRIFPSKIDTTDGHGSMQTVNKDGVDYYNGLIDGLVERGIKPLVTIYHWDLPQALMDAFGGWMSPEIVPAFANFAETCFTLFGDRVKYWGTINEPTLMADKHYGWKDRSGNCSPGNDLKNTYLTGHHIILAHAAAVQVYRTKFQAQQKGIIGLIMDIQWFEALTDSDEDMETHRLAMDLRYGWFMDPIFHGDYPKRVRNLVGPIVPTFSAEESTLVKQSFDFLGVNYYMSSYVTAQPSASFERDLFMFPDFAPIHVGVMRDGVRIGPQAGSEWLNIVPSGLEKVLDWVRLNYNNPVIYITENGVSDIKYGTLSLPLEQQLEDDFRVKYHHDHLCHLLAAMRHGSDVRGYFAWSLIDCFEWFSGYTVGFGLHHVDRKTMARVPKASAQWFQRFLRNTPERSS